MTSRITPAALPVVVASALTTLATSAPAQDKPNIVIIMTDNLGFGDLGVYGSLGAPTPRIDALAREGVQFRDFHYVLYERFGSLVHPARDLGVLPQVYNLRTDPKELYNLVGRSGGTPMYVPLMKAAAPYLASFQEYPNGDYSMMTRDR